jgi:hypothetical protein
MLFLSELASAEVQAMLERANAGPTEGLRLRKEGERLVLQLDSLAENDLAIHIGTRIGVIMSRETEAEVGDALLDVEEGPEGNRLIIGRIPEP